MFYLYDFITLKDPLLVRVWTHGAIFADANQVLITVPGKHGTGHWITEVG